MDFRQKITKKIRSVLWTRFYIFLVGKTNGAHHDFVKKLKGVGLTEVDSPEECDYLLVFCPVASRVGTDISEALNKMPAGKPTILVVMHHTFDTDHIVAESSRLVNNPNVCLTVDCLFYEHHFVKCNRNDIAWCEVQKHLGVSVSQIFTWKIVGNFIRRYLRSPPFRCVVWGTVIVGTLLLFVKYQSY